MITYFARHPNAANLTMLLLLVLGLSVLSGIERETFPEFSADKVAVSVIYPGAAAADVDDQICQELDDALNAVNQLDDLSCVSVDALASATLTLAEGGDIIQFYNDISSIASSLNNLPDAAESPSVSVLGQTETIALLAISGIDSSDGLIRYADSFAARLGNLPKVANAEVSGISQGELKVTFEQLALRQYGISPRQVADAVAARSLRQPLGTIRTKAADLTLRYTDARRSIADLEALVVLQNADGGLVTLADLATVTLEEETPELKSFIDGARAAIIRIDKNKKDDAIVAFAEVQELLVAERARYGGKLNIQVINNTTEAIEERITLVAVNTLQGLGLVLIIMILFFSLKEAIWISLTLPISLLGGIFFMQLFGVTINMISLVALLMSVGLIMDDSIVIADNIAKWRAKVPPMEAAARATIEVFPGVASSFLTTASVFGPLMFLSGEIGSILKVVPVVLLITLAVSLVEAFLILPRHLSHVSGDPTANERRFVPRNLEKFKESSVIPAVRVLLRWRYLTLGTVFGFLILTIGLIASGAVKVIGFPSSEGDTIEARVTLTPGIPQWRTERVVEQILDALQRVNDARTPDTRTGADLVERILVRYAYNPDVKDNGGHTVSVTVDLLTVDDRAMAADDIIDDWRRETGLIPDLVQSNFTQTTSGPGGSDLDVQLASRDLVQLEAAASEMLKQLVARDDVTEAFQDFQGGKPEARLKLNEYAYTIGLTPQDVSNRLRTAFSGTETDTFRESFSNRSVRVELADSVATITEFENFPIRLADGKTVGLTDIADITLSATYPQVTRENGQAIAKIIGKIDRSATTSTAISQVAIGEIGPQITRQFPDVQISIGGAAEEQQTAMSSILTALMSGLVGVYLVLAFQFRSYTLPFVVMLSIPFALIGTVLGHLALGLDLSMPSFVGFASLSGVVVNNAILFLAFFQAAIKDGDYVEASVEAVRSRFRPVLLSSLTTFIGLVPIISETSPHAQTLVPLVVSVAFGLLASTLLVVFVLPSAMAIYFDFADVNKWVTQRETDATTLEKSPA